MLDRRVSGGKKQEVKVVVVIKEGELILYGEWMCKWEERTEGRR